MIFFKLYIPDPEEGGGDDPKKKKEPPKDYKATTPVQRRDWNDMLDKMQKDGLAGSKDLDQLDKNAAKDYIEKYRKDNPNTTVSSDMIPSIQHEHQQMRTGESFGGLNPDQTKVMRQQFDDNFMSRVLSSVGEPFNSALSRQYYPTFKKGDKDYGTDAEAYMKDFAAAKPKDGGGGTSGKSGIIPYPDYGNQKSRDQYLVNWSKKYGNLEGRGDTVLKVNEVPRGATEPIKAVATKAAKEYGIDPSLLYASFMEEGGSGLFKNKDGTDTRHRKPGDYGYQGFYGDKEFPINGNESLGMPNFNQVFPDLVAKGYLSNDFASRFRGKDGEYSGNDFKTLADGLKAKAAWMKMSYDEVDKYAKEKGVTLSKNAKDFFALADFNSGGSFKKILNRYDKEGLLKDDKFLKEHPHKDEKIEEKDDVWAHVSRRLRMADALKKEKHFDDSNSDKDTASK